MSERAQERGGRGPLVFVGLAATLALHGAILGLVVVGHARAGAEPLLVQGHVVDVQAVRFGKPRDLSFLPHKQLVPAAGPKPKLALTENDQALPHLKDPNAPPPPAEDPLKRTHAQLFKEQSEDTPSAGAEGEGDPRGLRGGTATVGKGPIYYQHLQAAVQNAWMVPTTISDEELAHLRAMACVKIDASGKIVEYGLRISSRNSRFDATLLDALGSVKQFDPPTPDVIETVTTDGVCMNFAKTR